MKGRAKQRQKNKREKEAHNELYVAQLLVVLDLQQLGLDLLASELLNNRSRLGEVNLNTSLGI